MKSFMFLLLTLSLYLLVTPAMHGQTGDTEGNSDSTALVLVGVESGISRNFHSGGFRFVEACDCPVFKSGTGWGYSAGIVADFLLGNWWGLRERITFESRPGHFQRIISGSTTAPDTSLTADVTYQLLTAASLYRQDLAEFGTEWRLAVLAGPSFSYPIHGNLMESRIEQGETMLASDGPIEGLHSIQFAIELGTLMDFHATERVHLNAGLYYSHSLNDVTANENWQLSAFDLRLGVLMEL